MNEKHYANVHRGIHWLSDQSTDRYEETREKVRQFINAPRRNEVIFTTGATASINLVARSWGDANVGEGDEILVTDIEHHSNLVPLHQLAERTGCKIKSIPITDDGHLIVDELDTLLTDRTRLVAVAAVSNVLGTINPVREIIAKARSRDIPVLLDGAQGVPHMPIDVQALDCDFYTFSAHKMFGPTGIGILYGREELLERVKIAIQLRNVNIHVRCCLCAVDQDRNAAGPGFRNDPLERNDSSESVRYMCDCE